MTKSNFNHKKRLFIGEYLASKNATQAAISAGYSPKTARSAGARLLTNVDIKVAIENGIRAQEQDAERRAEESGITKERWVKELARIAFANIEDLITIAKDGQMEIRTTVERDPLLGAVVKKVSQGKHGLSLELHSKQAALEAIGKHMGWLKKSPEPGECGSVQVI